MPLSGPGTPRMAVWLAVLLICTQAGQNETGMEETVLVIDDHEGFRACARRLLQAEGFQVIGEAADAASGIEAARSLRPDVVLVDVQLPDYDGVLASRRIGALNGGTSIILTSSRDLADLGGMLADCPALGFIPKSELCGATIRALLSPRAA
jgi:DNA-binding NarL/FixJ family response regulator